MGALKPLLFIGLGVLALGNVLHIVGMATPAWSTYSQFGREIEVGPIRSCGEHPILGEECEETETDSSDVHATVAMLVLGMLAGLLTGLVAIVIIAFGMMGRDRPAVLPTAAVGASGVSFLFIIVGVIIWAAKVHADMNENPRQPESDLGWSFALCIVGALLILGGGFFTMAGSR